uniref:Right handed beta helix domain-containing protein n=2 Tax=Ditylum brightwellii TaxID=49249 RepID=A0A7S4RI55_9STRA
MGCGNGIFITPGVTDVNIEANYIWGNGNVNSIHEHNVYTEALRISYKYNRFGTLCSGCSGNNLKDRSAGLLVAYNFIEGGNRQLDLVDSSTSSIIEDPSYKVTHVYGNIFVEPDGEGNRQIVHYGGDSGNEANYRNGHLYFYHNSILSTRVGKTTLVRLSSEDCTMNATNNIIKATETVFGNNFELLSEKRGALYMNSNWITDGYIYWVTPTGGGSIFETGNILESTTGSIFSDPNFHTSPYDLHLSNSLLIGSTLEQEAQPISHEYVMHTSGQTRSSMDLGAYGYLNSQTSEPTRAPTTKPVTPFPTQEPVPTFAPTLFPTPHCIGNSCNNNNQCCDGTVCNGHGNSKTCQSSGLPPSPSLPSSSPPSTVCGGSDSDCTSNSQCCSENCKTHGAKANKCS